MVPAHSSAALALAEPPADPALAILRSVFGYPSFRGQQAEIIAHVIQGGDALVPMAKDQVDAARDRQGQGG